MGAGSAGGSSFSDHVGYGDFHTAFAGRLTVGDPTEAATVVGPVISGAQQQRILDYIESGRTEGEVVVGGNRPEHLERGYYVEPTLITGSNDMRSAREEIFGPVVVAIPFDDDDEGIAIANDSEFGLYDYVFSGDTSRAFRVAKLLRAGHVGINTAQRTRERMIELLGAYQEHPLDDRGRHRPMSEGHVGPALAQEIGHRPEPGPAVEIIGVDDREGLPDLGSGRQDGVGRAPGFLAVRGALESGR